MTVNWGGLINYKRVVVDKVKNSPRKETERKTALATSQFVLFAGVIMFSFAMWFSEYIGTQLFLSFLLGPFYKPHSISLLPTLISQRDRFKDEMTSNLN